MSNSYVVLAGALRLRAAPGDGTVLTLLPRGQIVEKIEEKPGQLPVATSKAEEVKDWLHVVTRMHERDFKGYVRSSYVMSAEPAPPSHGVDLKPTKEQLLTLAPTARDWIVEGLSTHLPAETQGLFDTSRRLCHFLAQSAHETAGFRTLEEYGGPSYWGRYEGRADLGNTQPGDGVLFHGRGIFQLTGRCNYQKMGPMVGLELTQDPDLAEDPQHSLRIACEYWKVRKLQQYADANDIETVTRRINGGLNGFEDRKLYYRRAWSIWGEQRAAGV